MNKVPSFLSALARLAGLLSLPVALLGQWLLDHTADHWVGWVLLAAGGILFLLGFAGWRFAARGQTAEESSGSGSTLQAALVLVGGAASVTSYAFLGENRLRWGGFLLWQGGLWLLILGVMGFDWLRPTLARFRHWAAELSIRVTPTRLALLAVVAIGAVLRLWRIAELPAEPGVDLPLIVLAARQVLEREWPIFSTLHPGREGLYIYMAAGYGRLFGISYPALRSMSALIGVATIPLLYLLGKRLFSRPVGLVAALLLAVSRWHIILSRTGLRFILMPLFTLLLLLALERALHSKRPWPWIWTGLVLGWGFHTYNAWMVMPALVVGGLALHQIANRKSAKIEYYRLALALTVALLCFIPLARFGHDNPFMFSLRISSRLVSSDPAANGGFVQVAWGNFLRTAGMFNRLGDSVAHINVPLKRQLGLVSGALFVPGLAYLVWHWRRYALLLLGLAVACLPTAMAFAFPDEVPNAGRASGAVGLACLIAAVPLSLWTEQFALLPTAGRRRISLLVRAAAMLVLVFLTAGGLVGEAWESQQDYFETYPTILSGGNYPISTRITERIVELGESGTVYLKAYPHFYDGNALRTQLWMAGVEWERELLELTSKDLPLDTESGSLVVLLHPEDVETLGLLQEYYPKAAVLVNYDNHGVPALLTLVAASP